MKVRQVKNLINFDLKKEKYAEELNMGAMFIYKMRREIIWGEECSPGKEEKQL